MKLGEIRRKLHEIDEINEEINFLEHFTEEGIHSMSIRPNFNHERTISTSMMEEWFEDSVIEVMESRMREINSIKREMLAEIGAEE